MEWIVAVIGVAGVVIGAIITHGTESIQKNKEYKHEQYIAYLISYQMLKANNANEDARKSYERARTSILLVGSSSFLQILHEFEQKCLFAGESVDLGVFEEYERRLIKQMRTDLGMTADIPDDIYLYDFR